VNGNDPGLLLPVKVPARRKKDDRFVAFDLVGVTRGRQAEDERAKKQAERSKTREGQPRKLKGASTTASGHALFSLPD
jgi:hypothetical protein